MTAEASTSQRALTFGVGGKTFALAAADVDEVILDPAVTRVPQAPAALKGVASVRGRVASIVALDRVLDGAAPGEGRRVIMLSGDRAVGLAVDAVHAMHDVEGDHADGVQLLRLDALLAKAFGTAAGVRNLGRVEAPRPAAVVVDAAAADLAYLEFRLDGQAYATPLDDVREVIPAPTDLQALPGADAAMLGVATLRDRLIPIISTAAVLGLRAAPVDGAARVVVVAVGEAVAGLLVEAVTGVLRAPASRVGATPAILNRAAGEARIGSIVRARGRLVSVLPAARVLDEATVTALSSEAGDAADAALADEGDIQRLLLFRLGDETYGLPIGDVEAVVPMPPSVGRAPGAPAFVAGLMSHRGRILPLIDQALRFGAAPADPAGRQRRVIVAGIGGLAAGLAVDAVDAVAAIPAARLQPAPDLAAEGGPFDRVARVTHDGRLILVADVRRLLEQAARDMAGGKTTGPVAP